MTVLHISHGADPDDWFVVKPLDDGRAETSIPHEMAVQSLLGAGRAVYELDLTGASYRRDAARKVKPGVVTPVAGRCPVCGAVRSLKSNGKIRHHAGLEGSAPRGSGVPALANSTRAYRCEGSGRLPKGMESKDDS